MSRGSAHPHPRRNKRYVLLLTPEELEMAKTIARREFRPLPDFFRRHIYEGAARIGLKMQAGDQIPRLGVPAEDS